MPEPEVTYTVRELLDRAERRQADLLREMERKAGKRHEELLGAISAQEGRIEKLEDAQTARTLFSNWIAKAAAIAVGFAAFCSGSAMTFFYIRG